MIYDENVIKILIKKKIAKHLFGRNFAHPSLVVFHDAEQKLATCAVIKGSLSMNIIWA